MLVEMSKDKTPVNVLILMNDEIEEIKCRARDESLGIDLDNLFKTQHTLEEIDLNKHRDKVVSWLQKNRLPVKVEQRDSTEYVINILDTVFICPPYGIDNCESTNEIVLDKVRKLIKDI